MIGGVREGSWFLQLSQKMNVGQARSGVHLYSDRASIWNLRSKYITTDVVFRHPQSSTVSTMKLLCTFLVCILAISVSCAPTEEGSDLCSAWRKLNIQSVRAELLLYQ